MTRGGDGSPQGPLGDLDLRLLDWLAIPASLHDVNGRFVYTNAAAERASGHSNEWFLGRHFTELLPPEAQESVTAQFRRVVDRGEPADFETLFTDASGQLRGTRAQHLPLRIDEVTVGVLILAFEMHSPIGADVAPQLTPRQREVLGLIASGASTSEIAEKLKLSTETVRNYVRAVLSELGAHTRVEAIAEARRLGLLAPPPLRPPRDVG